MVFLLISALIILITFSFHPCKRLTITVVPLPAWFFRRLTFLSLPVCFFSSPPSPFSFIIILPVPPSIYQVIFPLCLFSELCLSDLYVSPVNCSPSPSPPFDWLVPPLMFVNLVLLFSPHIPYTLICINAAPWCFSLVLHVVPQRGAADMLTVLYWLLHCFSWVMYTITLSPTEKVFYCK